MREAEFEADEELASLLFVVAAPEFRFAAELFSASGCFAGAGSGTGGTEDRALVGEALERRACGRASRARGLASAAVGAGSEAEAVDSDRDAAAGLAGANTAGEAGNSDSGGLVRGAAGPSGGVIRILTSSAGGDCS